MDASELAAATAAGRVVRLAADAWSAIEPAFARVERHDTRLRGHLTVYARPGGFLVVEEPASRERAVRALATADDVRRFVDARLEAYERMWDGCGLRIDYDR